MSVTSKYHIYSVKRPSWNKHPPPPPPITLFPPPPKKKEEVDKKSIAYDFFNALSTSHRMTWLFADDTLWDIDEATPESLLFALTENEIEILTRYY